MTLNLPSRYEDLDTAFRGRLKPNQSLLAEVKRAFSAIEISGGVRFLPVFGNSGSGKTSATLEIGTHLPELFVKQLPREAIEDTSKLRSELEAMIKAAKGNKIVAVIDQYEEVAAQKTSIPSNFVEAVSLLDRDRTLQHPIIFIWLTTSREFQADLSTATSRNRRILLREGFEIESLDSHVWPEIIQETFQFHNQEKDLSDYQILVSDLFEIADTAKTLGEAIEITGERLAEHGTSLQDLSSYTVVMLWPVSDALRITRVQQFTDPRQGYKLDWNSWYRQLNAEDQTQLPLRELNRARLYFDMRLVPIAVADLHPLCKNLDDQNATLGKSYLNRFENTHFYSIIAGKWISENFAPLRERESKRADDAREWYSTITQQPTKLGRRIAQCLTELGLPSSHEQTVTSPHGKVRADIQTDRSPVSPPNVLVEIKAFSAENTMPSTIASAIQTTLRRHAQFAGFIPR